MTVFSTGIAEAGRAFSPPIQGIVGYREASFTTAAALTTADVLKMIPVFAGETVLDVILSVQTDADTGTAQILNVGDDLDVDRYISLSNIGQTGGIARAGAGVTTAAKAANFPYQYEADNTIDIVVTTNAGTPVAVVTYTLIALIAS